MQVYLQSEVTLAPYFDFTGTGVVDSSELPSPTFTPGNVANNRLIQTNQDVKFRFDWSVKGYFAHIIDPNSKWRLEILLERMGPGEFALPGGVGVKTLTYGSGTHVGTGINQQLNYPGAVGSTTITIPGGTVPEGIYDVVAVLRLLEPGGAPCFLAAFAEFGKLDFYAEH
ncbi:MAG: hypothetical protein ACKVUS_20635 [Saprospiraceae bacterium]